MGDAVSSAGGRGLPFLLVARGTSDPDANGDAAKAARLVAEWSDAPFVHTGFAGVTGPSVPDALEVFARLGFERVALGFWFLCTGKLIEHARADIAAFSDRTGVTVVDAGYFGPDPRLVPIILQRYGQARIGTPVVNCDSCSYRAPWPGHEDRVGQPMGVGHSHLAAEHRHPRR
jgi:sirohydrochlorin ferrochelatase